jgi:hypothetical protein
MEKLGLSTLAVDMPKTKKQIILAYCREHGISAAGPGDIGKISEAIRRVLGTQERTSSSYIAQVLQQAGMALLYTDRYLGPTMPEPYASRLKGSLRFRDLASAESSLYKLDEAYRAYVQASDRVGIRLVRSLLLQGKQRALRLACDPRVDASKRREKQEIALWFTVWLQSPDLLFAWLRLRKQSEEFQRTFDAVKDQA